jgi:hypothetical protein
MEECSICTNNICDTNKCITNCNHTFCLSCILKHLNTNKKCPLCREIICESSEEEQSDSSEEEPQRIPNIRLNMVELKTYDIYGRFIFNDNLKSAAMILFITVNSSIIYLSVICALMMFNK